MDTTHAMQILQGLGYEVTFRSDTWIDCLATGHQEAWVGSGRNERAACDDLLRKMFPSRAAAALLEDTVGQPEQPSTLVGPFENVALALEVLGAPIAQEPPAELEDPALERAEGGLDTDIPTSTEATSDLDAETEAVKKAPAEAGPLGRPELVPPVETQAEPSAVVEPVVEDIEDIVELNEAAEASIAVEDALEILEHLAKEIDAEMDTLGRMAPSRLRLHVASWIFQARAVQEQFRRGSAGNRAIEDAVHRVALQLAHMCKIFWPGSVMALNLQCTPALALQGFFRVKHEPASWAEASAVLSAHIDEVEGRSFRDDEGWADRAALQPDAPKAGAVVAEAIALIEHVTGPLNMLPSERKEHTNVPGMLADLEDLVLAAHLLRWTRRSCPDGTQWGRAMGVLRWCARECRGQARDLEEVLSEDYAPTRGWAEMLGRDPEVNRRKKIQREVLEGLPAPDCLEEDLLGWLRKAFTVFNNPQIAKMAFAVRGEILSLSKADFADADRSTRSRLHRLQGILRSLHSEQHVKVDLPSIEDLKADPDEEDQEGNAADPAEVLLARVREFTQGKRILFVTNRDDTRLRDELARDLACQVILKNGGTRRMIQPIVDTVTSTRYDIVCMATGFNNHSSDAMLCRKAKTEGVPYVRVQKGRRLATIRALDRAFNLFAEGKPGDTLTSARVG